ncbi:MAG: peptide chain release factor H [Bacillota bacterium]|nr:peptide chain release factor H [Bacillota bacterium]
MWIQISAGNGPAECCRFVYLFLSLLQKECMHKDIKIELLDFENGEFKDTFKSVFLKLEGKSSYDYASSIAGSHLWIWNSQYRKNHKRKNWFIEVKTYNEETSLEFDEKDIIIEKMRSSGKGGQHVNKTETAIRITHKPTGIVVKSMEERSQYQNIKLAKARLANELSRLKTENEKAVRQERWIEGINITRGNAVRIFKDNEFIEVK